MARLDAYIDLLFKDPASELVMETGTGAVLRTAAGTRPVLRQSLTTAQIIGAFSELVPPELQDSFPGHGPLKFRYSAPAGEVSVRFESAPDRVSAVVSIPQAHKDPRTTPIIPPPPPPRPAPVIAGEGSHGIQVGPAPEDAGAAMAQLLELMLEHRASDLHLSSTCDPCLRKDGDVVPLEGHGAPDPDRLREMIWSIAPEKNRQEWEQIKDTDFAHETAAARFRVNVFADRRGIGAVLRVIPNQIRSAEEMGLSQHMLDLCHLSKGLVLVTGPTGSGKSTTLAAMVDYINRTRSDHIITIEDPIEFVHPNKKCLVNQREIRVHTQSFKHALRAALREDPDIVLVGEMRDLETISIALETAETGHLVFGTLHTNTAPSTVDRIIDQFPADRQEQIRTMLSESLKGVITQMLCKKIGGGRVAAQEVLLCNGAVSNLIREGKTFQIASIMQTGRGAGMQTMNDALLELVRSKQVLPKEALSKAVHKAELRQSLERAGFRPD
ncbi:MAG TPA: type IV pilus twitching motility protein PilT, partial [Myxococcales bacterium]|nr:type IV pilus twitching motility protein PilT [Myxococcales bacterium]